MYIILSNSDLKKLSPAEMQMMILNSDPDTFKAISEVIANEERKYKYQQSKKKGAAGVS